MEVIRSSDNKKIKQVSALKDKSCREETHRYFAEGLRWVADALKTSPTSDIVDYILVKESKITDYIGQLGSFDRVFAVDDGVFDKLSETKNGQGILAVLKMLEPEGLPSGKKILYLDRIRDPGNMGAIIRTACAADYKEIVCDNCVDAYNPKVVRSCMSAILHIKIFSAKDVSVSKLKESGYSIAVADADGQSVFALNSVPDKVALVIGNEAEGVSKEIFDLSDMSVSIPMSGKIESLNAAVSAAILMYNLKNIKGE